MIRPILHFLYTLIPHALRVWGNKVKTEFRLGLLRRPIGRTGKAGGEGYMYEHHGKMVEGYLVARVTRANGKVETHDLGGDRFAAGPNTVVDAGVAAMVNDWFDGSKDITAFNYHAMGTGGSPPSTPTVSATALVTEVESRSSGVKSKPAANQIRTVATITATASRTINEWGLLDAATVGTLWSTRWFTAISLASGDAIEFTYTLTISSFTA